MDTLFRFAAGLLIGAMVGASVVMLTAPRPGEETRRLAQRRIEAVLEEGRKAAQSRRQELEARLAAMKSPEE